MRVRLRISSPLFTDTFGHLCIIFLLIWWVYRDTIMPCHKKPMIRRIKNFIASCVSIFPLSCNHDTLYAKLIPVTVSNFTSKGCLKNEATLIYLSLSATRSASFPPSSCMTVFPIECVPCSTS